MFKSLSFSLSSVYCMFTLPGGRQADNHVNIYKTRFGCLNGELHCLYFEAHAECTYLWLIYELRWVL